MERSRMNLPRGPDTLCFDKDEFTKVRRAPAPGSPTPRPLVTRPPCAPGSPAPRPLCAPALCSAAARPWARTPLARPPRKDLAALRGVLLGLHIFSSFFFFCLVLLSVAFL